MDMIATNGRLFLKVSIHPAGQAEPVGRPTKMKCNLFRFPVGDWIAPTMADNTPRGDYPNEPLSLYDALPAPVRRVVREAGEEYACGPLGEHFRRSGMTPEDYAEMLGRAFNSGARK